MYTNKQSYDLAHCQPRWLSVKKGENMDFLNPIAVWIDPNDCNSSVVLHKLSNGTYATHLYHRDLNQLSFGHYHGKDLRSAWYDYQARTKAEI
ncbi:hypothetical protein [Microseira wollei]|nr:hypothetical protein [Microseira wollei]